MQTTEETSTGVANAMNVFPDPNAATTRSPG